ncbi:metallophosphoesterase family protein [Chitinophaga sp. 22620]|uniref:metallophosphoesterase family protein n=1 Tax=Chitinophaga sp. 22620 TaxID=3453952 RepID=UPI003F86780E
MRIALFSDVHANLPAMEAVLADIDTRKPDAVYCLGDLVGYNIWPNEVIELVKGREIPVIAGNHDFDVARMAPAPADFDPAAPGSGNNRVYTNFLLTPESRQYLSAMQEHRHVQVPAGAGSSVELLLVHGSPRAINEYLFEDHDEDDFQALLEKYSANIMCFGHTHRPFHRKIGQNGHVINLGAVGKPKDSDPRACYVILDVQGKNDIKVEFVRVAYDVEKAAKAVEQSPLPDDFADMLRKAY